MAIEITEEALAQMRAIGGMWAAYTNVALDSANLGHCQFLLFGADCTFKRPPKQYPVDNMHGMGWRYVFSGVVDLATGVVETDWKPSVTIVEEAGKA